MERVKSSIHNYFSYLIDRELREFESMRHTSFILFIIGVSILFLSVWIDNKTAGENSVITHMFAEGLYVASWVSLWHAIATFLINWAPHRKKVKLYRRISSANIQFYNVELASVEDVPQLSAVF